MTDRIRLLLVVLTIGLVVPLDAEAQTSPTPVELVRQLGDPSFSVREQATKRLLAIGRAAVPALEAGSKSSDPETVDRCERILLKARRTDREILLDNFAADPKGEKKIALAGWERFRKLAGDDPASRQVFVENYRMAGDILELLETDPTAATIQFSDRCQAIRKRQNAITNGPVSFTFSEVLSTLMLATDPRLKLSRENLEIAFSVFGNAPRTGELSNPAVSKLLKGLLVEAREPLMAVRLIWVGRSVDPTGFDNEAITAAILRLIPSVEVNAVEAKPEQQSIQFFLLFGEKTQLKEIIPLAKRTLRNSALDPMNHVISMQILVKLLGAEAIPAIEESLADRREMGSFKPGGAVRGDWITHKVSDTALSALLMITGQTQTDYGFPYATAFPQLPVTLGTAADGFYNDRDRESAIKTWREWRSKNPMKKSVKRS